MSRSLLTSVSSPRLAHVSSSLSLARQAFAMGGESGNPLRDTTNMNSLTHTTQSRGGLRDSHGGLSPPHLTPHQSGQSGIQGQSTLQSFQKRRISSSMGGLSVINSGNNSGISMSRLAGHQEEERPTGPTHVPFVGSLGGRDSGLSGGGSSGNAIRPTSPFSQGGNNMGTTSTLLAPSKNHVPSLRNSIRGSIPKQRMGNLMLRELSRRDVLGPQSGQLNALSVN